MSQYSADQFSAFHLGEESYLCRMVLNKGVKALPLYTIGEQELLLNSESIRMELVKRTKIDEKYILLDINVYPSLPIK
jgi:hypothetical protein